MKRLLLILFCLTASTAHAADWWGQLPDGGTLYFYANTLGQDGEGETPASEAVVCYKDGSDTELTTGVSIDDDIDSVTGLHRISVDTTQTGFDAGSRYTIVYSAGTSDSVSIAGRVVGSFALGPQEANAVSVSGSSTAADNLEVVYDTDFSTAYDATLDMFNVNVEKWLASDAEATMDEDDVASAVWDALQTNYSDAGSMGQVLEDLTATAEAIPTNPLVTNDARLDFLDAEVSGAATPTQVNTQVDAAIETYRLDELFTAALSGQPTAGSLLADLTEDDGGTQRFNSNALEEAPSGGGGGLDAAETRAALGLSSANLDTQLADIPTVSEFNARTLASANYFDPTADTVANVTLVGTLTTYTGNTPQTGDSYARLGAPADTNVSTDIANIRDFMPATGPVASYGNVNAVETLVIANANNLSDMAGATFDTATDSLEALRNRGDASWITATGFATASNVTTSEGVITTAISALNDFDPSSDVVTTDSASRTASQADVSGLTTVTSAIKVVTDALSPLIVGGKFTATALEDAPTGGGGGGGTALISPITVSDKRTFHVGREGYRSSNIVTVAQGFAGTLAVRVELNDGSDIDINGTHTVTITGAATVVATDISTTPDGEAIHFDVPALTTVGDYTVVVTAETVDSQTIPLTGKLVVR